MSQIFMKVFLWELTSWRGMAHGQEAPAVPWGEREILASENLVSPSLAVWPGAIYLTSENFHFLLPKPRSNNLPNW